MKNRIYIKLLNVVILCMFMCLHVKSQYKEPIYIPSPNTTEIMRYGDVPVSLFSGVQNIEIPIYYLNQNGVDLQVSLKYNSSGVLVNTLPSWIGTSWILEAGGCIMRNTKGDIDEREEFFCPDFRSRRTADGSKDKYFLNWFECHAGYNKKPNGLMQIDCQPDIFVFSFLGKHGEFYLGNDGEWKVDCDDNLVVEFDISDADNYIYPFIPNVSDGHKQQRCIKGFNIYDLNGNKFIFGGKGKGDCCAIEYSMDLFESYEATIGPWDACTWYLTEIQDRFGNRLYSFNYERGYFMISSSMCDAKAFPTMTLLSPVYLKEIKTLDNHCVEFIKGKKIFSSHDFYQYLYDKHGNTLSCDMGKLMPFNGWGNPFYYLTDPKFIKYQNPDNIYKNEDPLFSMGFSLLKNINVKFKNESIKSYELNYCDNKNERIHLLSVDVFDVNNNSLGVYNLRYDNFKALTTNYLSTTVDDWGYCSMNDNKIDTISSKWGALIELTYPTGGKTTFEYENNMYRYFLNPYRECRVEVKEEDDESEEGLPACLAGGLRVKNIKNYDTDGKLLLEKKYKYSNGHIISRLTSLRSLHYGETNAPNVYTIVPVLTSSGNYVGYSNVTEFLSNGVRKEYRFHNLLGKSFSCYPEGCMAKWSIDDYSEPTEKKTFMFFINELMLQLDEWTDREHLRGKLYDIKTYDNNKLIDRIEYSYEKMDFDKLESKYNVLCAQANCRKNYYNCGLIRLAGSIGAIPTSTWRKELVASNIWDDLWPSLYRYYYFKCPISTETHRTLCGEKWVTDIIEYEREYCPVSIRNSKGYTYTTDVLLTKSICRTREGSQYRVVYEYPKGYTLTNDYFFVPILSETKYCDGFFLKANKTIFEKFNNILAPYKELYSCSKNFYTEVVTYDDYDNMGRLLKYTDKYGVQHGLIWNENNNVIAYIKNCDEVTYRKILNAKDKLADVVKGMFDDESVEITSCEYDSMGNICSITLNNYQTILYEYDKTNRLVRVKNSNGKILTKYDYNYSTQKK